MKKQTIVLGILAIAVISGAAFFAAEKNKKTPAVEMPIVADTVPTPEPEEQPSGKIDEHLTINNELRDVNFCGKTYKVKQILIDGVDVVQRVAELATDPKKGDESICGNVEFSVTRGKTSVDYKNSNELVIYGPVVQNTDTEELSYSFGIGGILGFDIKYKNLTIEASVAEEGGSVVIGKLK